MRSAPRPDRHLRLVGQAGGQFLEERQAGDRVGFESSLVDEVEGVLRLPPVVEGLEELLAALEVVVEGPDRDVEPLAQLGDGQRSDALTGDDVQRGLEVVVSRQSGHRP